VGKVIAKILRKKVTVAISVPVRYIVIDFVLTSDEDIWIIKSQSMEKSHR